MGDKKKMSDVLKQRDENRDNSNKTTLLKIVNEGTLLRTTNYTNEKKGND